MILAIRPSYLVMYTRPRKLATGFRSRMQNVLRAGAVPTRRSRASAVGRVGSRVTSLYGQPDWWGDEVAEAQSHGSVLTSLAGS